MPNNPHSFSSLYRKLESRFIDECQKRGLQIDSTTLLKFKERNLLSPIFESVSQQKKDATPYYDLFQIPLVSELVRKTADGQGREKTQAYQQEISDSFKVILPLLYDIRYFYQDKLYNFLTPEIMPPFPLPSSEERFFHSNFAEIFKKAKEGYVAQKYLAKHPLTPQELITFRDKIFFQGSSIDPMEHWYVFLRTIRVMDSDKFSRVKGSVLLAHDYYILAEILTYFYKDAFDRNILEPEDIFNGHTGTLKQETCDQCGESFARKTKQEKYCRKCKPVIAKTTKGGVKCFKCNTVLFGFADGDEFINRVFSGGKKFTHETDMITDVQLNYGKMTAFARCRCRTINRIEVEKGWF